MNCALIILQEEVLAETVAMVPDAKKRLQNAVNDLESFIVLPFHLFNAMLILSSSPHTNHQGWMFLKLRQLLNQFHQHYDDILVMYTIIQHGLSINNHLLPYLWSYHGLCFLFAVVPLSATCQHLNVNAKQGHQSEYLLFVWW